MKKYILIISLLFWFGILNASDLFTYQITDIGNNQIEVIFTVHFEIYDKPGCQDQCEWNFGDGVIQKNDAQYYYTHIYDLNNSGLISNGYFNVNVNLKYEEYQSSKINPCYILYTENYSQQISYFVGGANLIAGLFTKPAFGIYQIGTNIDFYYNIQPNMSSNNNNLSYAFTNRSTGVVIKTGFISQSDFYKDIKITQYPAPNVAGTYYFDLDIYQNNDLLLTKSIEITTGNEGTPAGNCACSNYIEPGFTVETVYSNGGVTFDFIDNSSQSFKTLYKSCSELRLHDKSCDNTITTLYQAPYKDFSKKTSTCIQPGLFDSPKKHFFDAQVTCIEPGGNNSIVSQSMYVVLPPLELPDQIDVSAEGETKLIYTNIFGMCNSYEIVNVKNNTDDLKWLSNIDFRNNLSFHCSANYSKEAREFDIRLYFNTNHENSFSIVNGKKVHYRTIHVTQPTKLTNFSEVTDNLVGIPDFDYPDGTAYFSVTGTNGTTYFYNPTEISMEVLKDALETKSYEITIDCWNSNGEIKWSQKFTVGRALCTVWNFKKLTSKNYDIYIHSAYLRNILLDNYTVEANKSVVIYVGKGNYISLGEGFHAKPGSYFNAKINGCLAAKSSDDSTDVPVQEVIIPIKENSQAIKITVAANNERTIKVFPNPTNGIFNIDVSAIEQEIKYIQVYNISGIITHEIKSEFENINKIDLSNYSSGIYIVRILAGDKLYFNKIIKE